MAELNVRIDLSFGARSLRCIMAAGMIFSVATEVASESVTLTTYYPAPSGVYSAMITTGNTWLDRDNLGKVGINTGASALLSTLGINGGVAVGTYATVGPAAAANNLIVSGSVGIGKAAPAGALDVVGVGYLQQLLTTGNNTFNTAVPTAADFVIGSNTNGGIRHDSSMMFWSNASASRIFNQNDIFYLSVWNVNPTANANVILPAGVGQTSYFKGPMDATSTLTSHDLSCAEVQYTVDGSTTCAAAGFGGASYVTVQAGVISSMIMMPLYSLGVTGGTAPMLCCSCPASGCPL